MEHWCDVLVLTTASYHTSSGDHHHLKSSNDLRRGSFSALLALAYAYVTSNFTCRIETERLLKVGLTCKLTNVYTVAISQKR